MSMKLECQDCKQSLEAEGSMVGQMLPCLNCNKFIDVPVPSSLSKGRKANKMLVGLVLLLIISFVSYSDDQVLNRKTGWELFGVKGKVKERVDINYHIENKFGEEVKKVASKRTFNFNDKGTFIEGAIYNADGVLTIKSVPKYDDGGVIIEAANYNADGVLIIRVIFTNDDRGNPIRMASYKADGTLTSKSIFKNDDKGNPTETANYKADGTLTSKFVHKYDDKGNEIERADYNADGALTGKEIPRYDDKGNEIERQWYIGKETLTGLRTSTYTYYEAKTSDTPQVATTQAFNTTRKTVWDFLGLKGKVKEWVKINYNIKNRLGEDVKEMANKSILKYDDKSNQVEGLGYDADGNFVSKTVSKYDNNGNKLVSAEYDADGVLKAKVISKYDDKGNKIEEALYNADGALMIKYLIKYDDKGNNIGQEGYSADGTLENKHVFRHDGKGILIEGEFVIYKAGRDLAGEPLAGKYIYKYDVKGNNIELAVYRTDGSLAGKSVYKYDDKGNKIEEAGYDEKGNLSNISTSSYTYENTPGLQIPSGFVMVKGSAADTNGWASEIRHIATGIEMVYVAPGEFMMGSPSSEKGRCDYETQHKVRLTKGYYIGKYEVTQRQWEKVMGSNPSRFKGVNLPVENVGWDDCQEFCKKLGIGFRLPTEAEWEYAARGGNKSKGFIYSGSNNIDEVGWYDKNSASTTHEVGLKKANELGIYDMSGNAWEWCSDWYRDYPSGAVTDPVGAKSGYRMFRGGGWEYGGDCRSAYRFGFDPSYRGDIRGGFRLCLTPGVIAELALSEPSKESPTTKKAAEDIKTASQTLNKQKDEYELDAIDIWNQKCNYEGTINGEYISVPQLFFSTYHPVGTAKNIVVHKVDVEVDEKDWKQGKFTPVKETIRFTLYWEGPVVKEGFTKIQFSYDVESKKSIPSSAKILSTNGITNEETNKAATEIGTAIGEWLNE